MVTYPRSPKLLLGGIAHLARLIDKVRLRHAGLIQDYNYLTAGFDRYLLEFLQVEPAEFERCVLEGGTDDEILAWVRARARPHSAEELEQWRQRVLTGGPKDEAARLRFHGRLAEVAAKRRVPVESLPAVSTWSDLIDLDEERL
jgi:hypothetical protein